MYHETNSNVAHLIQHPDDDAAVWQLAMALDDSPELATADDWRPDAGERPDSYARVRNAITRVTGQDPKATPAQIAEARALLAQCEHRVTARLRAA